MVNDACSSIVRNQGVQKSTVGFLGEFVKDGSVCTTMKQRD